MSDYCLRFNAAVIEVNDLTAENEQLQKRIAELKKALSQIEVLLEPGSWVFGTSLGNDSKRLYILNLLKRITEGGEG